MLVGCGLGIQFITRVGGDFLENHGANFNATAEQIGNIVNVYLREIMQRQGGQSMIGQQILTP